MCNEQLATSVSIIIKELSDTSISVSRPLLKAKILAHSLKNKLLLDWINSELRGYTEKCSLPECRVLTSFLYGSYMIGGNYFNNQRITLPKIITDSLIEDSEFSRIYESQDIASLEKIYSRCEQDSSKDLGVAITDELFRMLDFFMRNENPTFNLLNVNRIINQEDIYGIISYVRNTLLDFMLEFRDEFGILSLKEVIQSDDNVRKVDKLVNQYIKIEGINNTVNLGDNSSINTAE